MINIAIAVREANLVSGLISKLREWEEEHSELICIRILDQNNGIGNYESHAGDAIFVESAMNIKNSAMDLLFQNFNIITIVFLTYRGDFKLYQKERGNRIPQNTLTVEQIMNKIILKIFDKNSYFFFNMDKKKLYVKLSDIMYIEYRNNKIQIYLSNNEKSYIYKGTIGKVYEALDHNMFVRCHQSFIINIIYIDFIEGNTVNLKKYGQILPISRKYRPEINKLKKVFRYYYSHLYDEKWI